MLAIYVVATVSMSPVRCCAKEAAQSLRLLFPFSLLLSLSATASQPRLIFFFLRPAATIPLRGACRDDACLLRAPRVASRASRFPVCKTQTKSAVARQYAQVPRRVRRERGMQQKIVAGRCVTKNERCHVARIVRVYWFDAALMLARVFLSSVYIIRADAINDMPTASQRHAAFAQRARASKRQRQAWQMMRVQRQRARCRDSPVRRLRGVDTKEYRANAAYARAARCSMFFASVDIYAPRAAMRLLCCVDSDDAAALICRLLFIDAAADDIFRRLSYLCFSFCRASLFA